MDVAIIGGGAAGFFLAVNLKELAPQVRVTIFEKQTNVLKKVLVSGGGRCNLTNSFEGVTDLKQVYPRGHRLLKGLFKAFGPQDAFQWFETHGVPLTTQDDHCVFPAAQDARAVTDCLKRCATNFGVAIKTSHAVENLIPQGEKYEVRLCDSHNAAQLFDYVAVTTGGSPRGESLHYLEQLSHRIETPVPSLFTFNVPDPSLRKLMGTVVEPATASIPGTKFRQSGALLITHWGLSGPAILKLSSHAARHLHENSYKSPVLINWTNETNTETVVNALQTTATQHSQKFITGIHPFGLPSRLWIHLIDKCSIPRERKWGEIGQKGIRRLADTLCNDRYEVDGRSTFREEFVTCGGISLESVHRHSLESKSCPGLYFAGEVLDIDGVTGGFNFQAAWSTAHAVAQDIAKKQSDLDNEDIQPTSK